MVLGGGKNHLVGLVMKTLVLISSAHSHMLYSTRASSSLTLGHCAVFLSDGFHFASQLSSAPPASWAFALTFILYSITL